MAAAETQYRAVLEARPGSAQVRVQLAEALLNQRRYAEAADESTQIDDDNAYAGLAARIELWSRIAAGDLEGAAVGQPPRRAARRVSGRARGVRGVARARRRRRRGAPQPAGGGDAAARRDPRDAAARPRLRDLRAPDPVAAQLGAARARAARAARLDLSGPGLPPPGRAGVDGGLRVAARRSRAARAGPGGPAARSARGCRRVRRRGAAARSGQRRRPGARRRWLRNRRRSGQAENSALKFSALRSITPPEREGTPVPRKERASKEECNELRYWFGGPDARPDTLAAGPILGARARPGGACHGYGDRRHGPGQPAGRGP